MTAQASRNNIALNDKQSSVIVFLCNTEHPFANSTEMRCRYFHQNVYCRVCCNAASHDVHSSFTSSVLCYSYHLDTTDGVDHTSKKKKNLK